MSSIAVKHTMWLHLFRQRDESEEFVHSHSNAASDLEVPGIRCPLCKWRPRRTDKWMCWDCDHPEYFYGGCGTEWNTFETRGVCPTCLHQWKWTTCFRCFMWSKHEDWYESEAG